ncbi:Gellan lyase precursor [compost metagenome]
MYDAAVVGTLPGQYPQAAKDAFGIAINAAKAVKDNSSATQSQVDGAVTDLLRAVDTFKSAVIKEVSADLNKDGVINVGDLAIVAYHYGKDSTSPDWAKAKIADLNGDQKIDITDLAFVATKILN